MSLEPKCPWCDAALDPGESLCLNCMKQPADHPSRAAARTTVSSGTVSAGTEEEKAALEAAFELDLDLPVKSAPAPKPAPDAKGPPAGPAPQKQAAGPGKAPSADLGELDDEDAGAGGDLAIDLADIGLADKGSKPKNQSAAAPKPKVAAASRSSAAGAAPQTALGLAGDIEVAELADYGTAPIALLPCVPYAIKVWRRKRELTQLCAKASAECERQQREVQGKLAQILAALRGRFKDHAGLLAAVRPIDEAAQLVQQRSSQLLATEQEHQAERNKIDEELAARAKDGEALQKERRVAVVKQEDAQQTQTRVKEELARVTRDLAAAHDAAAKAAGGAELAPPEHARRIAELDKRRAQGEADKAAAEAVLAEAKAGVAGVDRKVRDHERLLDELKNRRQALDIQAQVERQAGARAIDSAEGQKLAAIEAAVRKIAAEHHDLFTIEQGLVFEQADADLARIARDRDKHQRAPDAYDKDAFKRGVAVLAAAVAGVIALVVFLLARH